MENPVVLVILAMVFAAFVFTFQGLWFAIKSRRDEEAEKIRHRLGLGALGEEDDVASLLREQAADSALDALGNMGQQIQSTIRQAGSAMTVSTLVVYMGIAGVVASLVGAYFFGPKGLLFGVAAGYAPLFWIRKRATDRAQALLSQMPDTLEMMGRAMQTGAGLIDCFRLVQDEMPEPIATEFGQVSDEVRFGKDWRLALEQLVDRNPSLFDLRLFVSSILLQRETGGNMIETVNRISKLIRLRYAFDAKVKAMTSEARASGAVLAMMPLGVLVLILLANAAYLEPLWNTSLGNMAVGYALGSYGLGMFIMNSASKVEV